MTSGRSARAGVAAALIFMLAGCAGSASRGGSDQPGMSLPPSAAPGPAGAPARTSISQSSEQDIAAGLRANGVDNAEQWADLIDRNRPYPANDASLGKLRLVLTQGKAPAEVVDKVANALRP
jgi:hypothetical protein